MFYWNHEPNLKTGDQIKQWCCRYNRLERHPRGRSSMCQAKFRLVLSFWLLGEDHGEPSLQVSDEEPVQDLILASLLNQPSPLWDLYFQRLSLKTIDRAFLYLIRLGSWSDSGLTDWYATQPTLQILTRRTIFTTRIKSALWCVRRSVAWYTFCSRVTNALLLCARGKNFSMKRTSHKVFSVLL